MVNFCYGPKGILNLFDRSLEYVERFSPVSLSVFKVTRGDKPFIFKAGLSEKPFQVDHLIREAEALRGYRVFLFSIDNMVLRELMKVHY